MSVVLVIRWCLYTQLGLKCAAFVISQHTYICRLSCVKLRVAIVVHVGSITDLLIGIFWVETLFVHISFSGSSYGIHGIDVMDEEQNYSGQAIKP